MKYELKTHSTIVYNCHYHVVFCPKYRRKVLVNGVDERLKTILMETIDKWGQELVELEVMPDHVHLFCAPGRDDALSVKRWIAFWKSYVSKRWPRAEEQPIWQQDCWDTQLRRGENYGAKWEYVRNNAVRHRLARRAEDWPWQGELNVLEWISD